MTTPIDDDSSPPTDLVIPAQVTGGIIGVFVNYCEFWFVDIWLGAALATPLGIAFSVVREQWINPHYRIDWGRIIFPTIVAVGMAWFALLVAIPFFAAGKANRKTIRTMEQGSIRRIDIYEPFSLNLIAIVDDADALDQFVIAARDVLVHHPGARQPDEQRKWWVVVRFHKGRRLKIAWSHKSGASNIVFGMFIEGDTTHATNRGKFVSANLRTWFEKHVAQKLPQQ